MTLPMGTEPGITCGHRAQHHLQAHSPASPMGTEPGITHRHRAQNYPRAQSLESPEPSIACGHQAQHHLWAQSLGPPMGTEPSITHSHKAQHLPWAQRPTSLVGTEPGIAHQTRIQDTAAMGTAAWTHPSITPRSSRPPAPLAGLPWRQQLHFEGMKDGQTEGQGKLSSFLSSQGPDSSPGAAKPWNINNITS